MTVCTKCKRCRRAGEKLFLKGERCASPKCAIVKRNYPPGEHGGKGQQRLSEYGLQLAMKQRLKYIYGVNEAQLTNYFEKVRHKEGDIGRLLIEKLEQRLDNVVLRSGIADSMRQARQLVRHGFFEIGGRKVDIPSYEVRVGTKIKLKESKKSKALLGEKLKVLKKQDSNIDWVSFDAKDGEITVVGMPNPDQAEGVKNLGMVVEYYSR